MDDPLGPTVDKNILGPAADKQFWLDILRNANNLGWRGLVAETVGTPVDMATTVMRPFGYNHQAPVMGSDWIKNQLDRYGVTSGERQPMTEMMTSMLVPDAMDAARLTNALAPAMLGAIAYHGSPHKFSKFDMSKIGTGEGAQAYGHGLYFAESPGVARSYQAQLSQKAGGVQHRGMLDGIEYPKLSRNERKALDFYKLNEENMDYAIQSAKKLDGPEVAKILSDVKSGKRIMEINQGHLYKVDIPDKYIDNFLDWDKPLSEQPTHIRKSIMSAFRGNQNFKRLNRYLSLDMTGEDLYRYLQTDMPKGDKIATSNKLNEIGIKGIKYLDQGSRAAGKGTRNFVVFDDEIVKILERK